MRKVSPGLVAALSLSASVAVADTVVLQNGDTLNGKIGVVTAKDMKFTSDAFGQVTIPLGKVKTYKIDAPVPIDLKGKPPVTAQVSGEGTAIKAGEEALTFDTVQRINPPPTKWAGAVLANFALARGNTNKFTVGIDAKGEYRRENWQNNDRTTLLGQYNFGQSGIGDDKITDTDNFTVFGKYDRFWTQTLYGYAANKLEHDRVADLYFRETPSVGVGYQWIESPTTNFFTESGVGYVFENYDDGESNDYVTVRFAYHLEHKLSDTVSAFHNLEYLPSVSDFADYNLNTDAGLKVKLIDNFIAQLKVEYKRDSTPADDALENDIYYLVGLGWQF